MSSFCPKTPSMENILTSILDQIVAHNMLVEFTKPWILYSVSVLRYRGSKMKSRIYFENFIRQYGVYDLVRLLAKTWCPYLFCVLRNLPHKFEKFLPDKSRNLRKKRHHMGISQSSCPKKKTVSETASVYLSQFS